MLERLWAEIKPYLPLNLTSIQQIDPSAEERTTFSPVFCASASNWRNWCWLHSVSVKKPTKRASNWVGTRCDNPQTEVSAVLLVRLPPGGVKTAGDDFLCIIGHVVVSGEGGCFSLPFPSSFFLVMSRLIPTQTQV